MSHLLTRYEVVYRVFVDAHDEDEALDEVCNTGDLDPYAPDEINEFGDGDTCVDEDCEDDLDEGDDEE